MNSQRHLKIINNIVVVAVAVVIRTTKIHAKNQTLYNNNGCHNNGLQVDARAPVWGCGEAAGRAVTKIFSVLCAENNN